MRHGQPAAEIGISEELVRALLHDQFTELADEQLRLVGEGWDNATWKIGSDYAARIPRREIAVGPLLNEQRCLPQIAKWLPASVPQIVHAGTPAASYPWPWSIVSWIEGRSADLEPLRSDQGEALAENLLALHRDDPIDAPYNPYRSVALAGRQEALLTRLEQLREFDTSERSTLEALWRRSIAAGECRDKRWIHGDLHPKNVLVRNGALAAIIDWGDVCAGDPATDLAAAWMFFDTTEGFASFLSCYDPSEAAIARAAGWAALFGAILSCSGEPSHVPIGSATLRRLIRWAED